MFYVYLFIYLFIHPFIYLFIHPFIYLFIYFDKKKTSQFAFPTNFIFNQKEPQSFQSFAN